MTPAIAKVDGKDQLVSGAGDVVQGFDLGSGEKIWQVHSDGESPVPIVVLGDGMVFTTSGFGVAAAIRGTKLGGKGEVTKSHIAWEQREAVPMIPSMIHVNGHLFTIKETGIAMCLAPSTGEIVWKERLEGKYAASPVYADGKLYILAEDGRTTVIEAGPAFKVVAENRLGEGVPTLDLIECRATPAISQGQIFLRTDRNLYCIGSK